MNPERLCRSGLGKAYKKKALQNPMVKAEYDALQSEYDEKQLTISTRDHFKRQIQQNITQEDPLRPIRTMIPLLLSITNFWRRQRCFRFLFLKLYILVPTY